jgi:sugar phosphate isomerase/epimerase
MKPEIGLQIYSVRNALQSDYIGALDKIAAIGYKNLELITTVTDDGLVFAKDTKAAQLRQLLDQRDLKAVSIHMMPQEKMNWEKILDDCTELGLTSLVIPFAVFNNRQDVLDLCNTFSKAAEICKKHGVQFYYHNHFQEFQVFEGQSVMDTMLEKMDKDLVKFEFDSYWAIRGGQDVVAWLKKFGTRCDLLHQKDMPAGVDPVNLFELFEKNPGMPVMDIFRNNINASHFVETGEGTIDIPAIIKAGETYGNVRYIFVEQDMTSKDEFDSIAISFKNLSLLLAAE